MSKIYQKMYLQNKSRSKGVLGGFTHNVILRSCNSESYPLFIKRTGFTLIELLVVVLIIGILAAVALPQYRKAVARSHLAGMISLASSIAQAEQRHYMASGRYTMHAEALDISLPSGFGAGSASGSDSDPYHSYTDGKITINLYVDGSQGFARVMIRRTGTPAFILWGFDPSHYRYCGVAVNDKDLELGKAICSTYGEEVSGSGAGWGSYYYRLN